MAAKKNVEPTETTGAPVSERSQVDAGPPPQTSQELAELILPHVRTILEALLDRVQEGGAQSVPAARLLLDRAYGPTSQAMVLANGKDTSTELASWLGEMTDEQLRAIAGTSGTGAPGGGEDEGYDSRPEE